MARGTWWSRCVWLLAGCVAVFGCGRSAVTPVRATVPVPNDPDDPAIWVHPDDPGRSLILGTDKVEEVGGLYVFGLDGRLRQRVMPLDRPNNVDVEYRVGPEGAERDIAVVTERKQRRLRLFAIDRDSGVLTDMAPSGLPVLDGQAGEAGEPMGIAIYKRPRDGAVFVVVAPKTGETTDYLWQYRLTVDDSGSPALGFVRRFGRFSRIGAEPGEIGEIEAVVVDDELGYVYYSDERFGIRKYHADPDAPNAGDELGVLGTDGYLGDREGLAVYSTGPGRGYLVSSDQIAGGTRVRLYPREGTEGRPHQHPILATVTTASDETDGLEVVSRPLPGFPQGLLVMMNSGAKNFLLYDWQRIVTVASVD